MTVYSGQKAMAAGAFALALLCAAFASTGTSAQTAANPADVLAERETFTFTFRNSASPDVSAWSLNDSPMLELNAGQKWRFTFDLSSQNPSERIELDSLRAGAFFDVTPRMRLGGALSLSEEPDALTRASRGAIDGDVPEVKFESAFRF